MTEFSVQNDKVQIKRMAEMFKRIKLVAKGLETEAGKEMGDKLTGALVEIVEPYVNQTYIKLQEQEKNERPSS